MRGGRARPRRRAALARRAGPLREPDRLQLPRGAPPLGGRGGRRRGDSNRRDALPGAGPRRGGAAAASRGGDRDARAARGASCAGPRTASARSTGSLARDVRLAPAHADVRFRHVLRDGAPPLPLLQRGQRRVRGDLAGRRRGAAAVARPLARDGAPGRRRPAAGARAARDARPARRLAPAPRRRPAISRALPHEPLLAQPVEEDPEEPTPAARRESQEDVPLLAAPGDVPPVPGGAPRPGAGRDRAAHAGGRHEGGRAALRDDVREARQGGRRAGPRGAPGALPPASPAGAAPGAKVETAKAPGRWVSTSCGEPPRPSAVHAWRRAIVSASRSGEGSAGSRSENCAGRAGVGSARAVIRAMASRGGCASRSRRTSVRQVRASPEGAAGFSTRACAVPSTSPSSTASEAAFAPRAARAAQSGSSTRESRNASGSRPSTGQSSSSVVSKRSGSGAGTRRPSSSPRARRARRGPSGPKRSARDDGRQPREVADRAQAPAPEELLPLRRQAEEIERQRGERRRFPPRGHDGEAGARPREDERRRAREGEGRLGLDRARRGRVEERPAELVRRRPQAAEAGEVEEDGRRRVEPRRAA